MGETRSYRDLVVWQKAMALAEEVYRIAHDFPANEQYRMTAQLTRAVVSVPANIAEGNGRGTLKDYANFLSIAKGSLAEVETYLELAVRLSYVTATRTAQARALATEISKMLVALRRSLLTP